jgi:hypothetical protein
LELYEAAGRKRWEAGILFTQRYCLDENHWPSHLVDLTFIPIINHYVSSNLVETLSFGKNLA